MLHISNEHSALLKYWEVIGDYDNIPLVNFALKHNHFATHEEARRAHVGLQQWFACHLHPVDGSAPMVMLRGPVAQMYDAMVQHGEYEGFCRRYFGATILRHDINIERLDWLTQIDAVELMKRRICEAFGDECGEALKEWANDRRHPQILFHTSTEQPLTDTCYLYPKEEARIKSAT